MKTNKKYEILKMKAHTFDDAKINLDKIFSLPARVAIVGKSELSGKSNLVCNLLLRDRFYKGKFEPENMFIICASSDIDEKYNILSKELDIPEMNIMRKYNEDQLNDLYDLIMEEQLLRIEEKKRLKHYCFIFDDISFSGALKKYKNGIISKLACNGRHLMISTFITSQKYSDISTTFRENLTGLILYSCTNKQLDTIYEDHGLVEKKQFIKKFRELTNEPYSFMVINYSNPTNERYMDKNFEPVNME